MTKLERCTFAHDCHASGLNCAQSVNGIFCSVKVACEPILYGCIFYSCVIMSNDFDNATV